MKIHTYTVRQLPSQTGIKITQYSKNMQHQCLVKTSRCDLVNLAKNPADDYFCEILELHINIRVGMVLRKIDDSDG